MTNSRVNPQSCEKYLTQFRVGLLEPYNEGVYCMLEGHPEWLRIYFPGQQLCLAPSIANLAEEVLRNLVDLEHKANSVANAEEYEPCLMNIYVLADGEIELRYCSGVVNTEWGAYFRRKEEGEIEFVELG